MHAVGEKAQAKDRGKIVLAEGVKVEKLLAEKVKTAQLIAECAHAGEGVNAE